MVLGPFSLDRMERAVEKVRERLLRVRRPWRKPRWNMPSSEAMPWPPG